jgi:hypothetical protein
LGLAAAAWAQSPVSLPGGSLSTGVVGQSYSDGVSASGGVAPYTYALSGSLPPGLSLDPDSGAISGVPSADGYFPFSIIATDSSGSFDEELEGDSVAAAYDITIVLPPQIEPSTLPDAVIGEAYTQYLYVVNGGTGGYHFTLSSGSLPPGLSLDLGGTLAGTPTTVGSYTFKISASPAPSLLATFPSGSIERSYTIDVASPTIAIAPAGPNLTATTYVPYSQAFTASGGTAPYSFSANVPLPAGLVLDPTGVISGTPTHSGVTGFTLTATDANGATGTGNYSLVVEPPDIVIAPPSLPDGHLGSSYSQALTASGGSAPYSWDLVSGSLPAGLALDAVTGTISGTPTGDGSASFAVVAVDANGESGTQSYVLTIQPPVISLSPSTLPAGTVGAAYGATVTALGEGTPPYAFTLASGALPPGLSLSPSGTDATSISGTPTAAGSYDFVLLATDSDGHAGDTAYTLVVDAPAITLAPASLPDGQVGMAYSQAFSASGGTAPYAYAVSAGALPAGLVLGSDGALSGTPTAAGNYAFDVSATDSFGNTGSHGYEVQVTAPAITLSPASLPEASVGVAYAQAISASGGTAPYTFSLASGALPAGMTLSSDGMLAGTPTESGSFTFAVSATDSFGNHGSGDYVLQVGTPAITLSPASLPEATVGVAYAQAFSASGGTAPYAYSLDSGALPPGLVLAGDGGLSGTPTEAGVYGFTVKATDLYGSVGCVEYQLTVSAPAVTLSPASLPDALVGVAYSQAIGASGGTGPYSFSVASGALPDGIALTGGGTLAGTATESGNFAFAVAATDAFGNHGSADYVLHVVAPTIALTPASLPDGQVDVAYAQALEASGGSAPYSYAVSSGNLPAGLALSTGGALSGTPTASGSYAFAVTATDAHGSSGTRDYSLAIAEAAIPPPNAGAHEATTRAGTPVQVVLTEGASGGPFTGADVLSLTPANAGTTTVAPSEGGGYVLTFAPAPGFAGTATVLYTLSNAAGASGAGTVTIQVTPLADPLDDPDVSGLSQSQAAVSQVFAQTQVTNVVGRLDSLQGPRLQPWGFWVAGNFRRGDLDADGNAEGLTFETSGVTTGADRQFGDSFSFGLAGGLAQDRTLVGHRGSRNDARAHAAVGYGSFHPSSAPYFINVMHGHQRLRFQLRRFAPPGGASAAAAGAGGAQALGMSVQALADDGALVDSERTGGQDFDSLGAGYRYKGKAWTFTSYGRQDDVRTQLDAYTEPSSVPDALHYDPQAMRTRTSILGLRVDGTREIRWGTLLPKFKVELQSDNDDQGEVVVRYAAQPDGPAFRARPRALDNRRVAMEVGATLVTRHFLTLRLEYHAVLGGLFGNDNALVFSFEKEH